MRLTADYRLAAERRPPLPPTYIDLPGRRREPPEASASLSGRRSHHATGREGTGLLICAERAE